MVRIKAFETLAVPLDLYNTNKEVGTMLSILRKARLKDKEMRILMLSVATHDMHVNEEAY